MDVVGVVGDDLSAAVREAGGDPVTGDAATVLDADPDVLVAVGERALLDLVEAGADAPVLPVEAGPGLRSVPRESVADALGTLVADEYETVSLPRLAVRTPHTEAHALFDCMLVTSEPARISEYTVHSGGDRVATFRADGVVVATAAGSHGYARRAGGSVLAPGAGVVTVVPVAPFATDADDWVLPVEGLTLAVERDETPVELLADDRTAGTVATGESVRLSDDGTVTLAVVPESAGRFA